MKIQDIALNNKYTKWYLAIIENAKHRASTRKEAKQLLGFVEGHHIVPSSIYRNKDIVYLTLREHFIVHILLTKMLTGTNKIKMEEALAQFMQGRNLNSRQIAICMALKHKPCSDQRKLNISIGRKNTFKIKCDHCSKETDPGNFRRFHGDNCKQNPNIDPLLLIERSVRAKSGILKSKELGTFYKPKPLHGSYTCPYCNKHGSNYGVMMRHHFERCKHRESSDTLFLT